jgi:hypothetical protein
MNPRNIIYIWIDAKIQKEILTPVGHSQLEQKKPMMHACIWPLSNFVDMAIKYYIFVY